MYDEKIIKKIHPVLFFTANFLFRIQIQANLITITGFIVGILCCIATYFNYYYLALFLLLVNRFFDGVDGELARLSKPSKFGGFLDIYCDFFFYSLFPLSFALGNPNHIFAACFLIFSFVLSGTSFLASAIIYKNSKLNKSFYYLSGIIEGFETIILFVLILIFPSFFSVLAYIFGLLCMITSFQRVLHCWNKFN